MDERFMGQPVCAGAAADPWKAWPAPAKLNLFLHITARRADGFHELQTLFQFLDYGDLLDFEPTDDGRITASHVLPGVAMDDDLTVRAARRLRDLAAPGRGVRIHVHKRVPMGGGLGGGSSDAATTLVALDHLWHTGLGRDELARLGLELGADVPIFVHGKAAWAEGVGERLSPVDPPEPDYLVIHPGVHVATGAIFGHPGLTRDCPAITMPDFISGRAVNVCEPVVRSLHPEVARALDWLEHQGLAGRMTGTGSCVFAACASREQGLQVLDGLPGGWSGFMARGRNRSALHHRLEC